MITKHIGRHNNRKIVILYRKVPNEDHMALITYSDSLPQQIHDDLMKAVESQMGQQSADLADYLFRTLGNNGNSILTNLHKEAFIKKVPTNQIIVTPNTTSSIRLDELNTMLDKMALGEEAVKELAALDNAQGMVNRKKQNPNTNELRTPAQSRGVAADVQTSVSINEVLTDEQIAAQRLAQATRMENDAKQLLIEAERLKAEAVALNGNPVDVKKPTRKYTKKAKSATEA